MYKYDVTTIRIQKRTYNLRRKSLFTVGAVKRLLNKGNTALAKNNKTTDLVEINQQRTLSNGNNALYQQKIKTLLALCNSYTTSRENVNLIQQKHNVQQFVQLKENQYKIRISQFLEDKQKCKFQLLQCKALNIPSRFFFAFCAGSIRGEDFKRFGEGPSNLICKASSYVNRLISFANFFPQRIRRPCSLFLAKCMQT